MSTEITKVAFRFPLPELDGKDPGEVLPFYRKIIGEPEEIDEYEGVVQGFYYTSLPYVEQNPTAFHDFVRPVQSLDTKQWGAEVVLGILNHDYYHYNGWRPDVLNGHAIDVEGVREDLLALGFTEEQVGRGRVHAYTWHNGGDEPVTFE